MDAELPLPTPRGMQAYWDRGGSLSSQDRAVLTADDITAALFAAVEASPEDAEGLRRLLTAAEDRLREIAAQTRARAEELAADPRYVDAPEVNAWVTFQELIPETGSIQALRTDSFVVPLSWLAAQDREVLEQVRDREGSSDAVALSLGWTQSHPLGGGPLEVDGLEESLAQWLRATSR